MPDLSIFSASGNAPANHRAIGSSNITAGNYKRQTLRLSAFAVKKNNAGPKPQAAR